MVHRCRGEPLMTGVIETKKNSSGHQISVHHGPYNCGTCASKGKCDDDDFATCNYHEPCSGCIFNDACNDSKYLELKGEESKKHWMELSERLAGCTWEEKIPIGIAFFRWTPVDYAYCEKCSLWHPTGKYCTRHCEPCAARQD